MNHSVTKRKMGSDTKVSLQIGENTIDGKIVESTRGQKGLDLSAIKDSGYFVYDPGYSVTAVCRSSITYIDGEKGELFYRGHNISKFIERCDFLSTAYTLISGEWEDSNNFEHGLEAFKREINDLKALPKQVIENIRSAPRSAKPMAILTSAFAALASTVDASYMSFAIANAPRIIAYIHRHITNQEFLDPRSDLGYVENFLYMMLGYYNPEHAKILEKILILHADHEQNASTTTARGVFSTGADPMLAISAAVTALSGPLHGGANEEAINMLEAINKADDVGNYIDQFIQAVKNKEKRLMGFGHRIYRYFDPRSRILAKIFEDLPVESLHKDCIKLFNTAKKLENRALNDEYFKARNLYPNVDFYSGILERSIGINTNMFTPVFALARISGWVAHMNEARNDKEQKIVRPRQIYCGD